MSTRPAPARFWILFAAQAPRAVIVRRGPSKWFQLVLWETDSDTFTPGQWIQGRVTDLSLSLDGQHLAMGMMGGASRSKDWLDDQYTFVSKPPYFTALAIAIDSLRDNSVGFSDTGSLAWEAKDIQWRAVNRCPYPKHVSDYPIYKDPQIKPVNTLVRQTEWSSPDGRKFVEIDGGLYEDVQGEEKLLLDLNQFQPTEVETPEWALRW